MLPKQLQLTNELTSPLFRIMWISNFSDPYKRHFDNNICAFHIGNGFILSVAHNLRAEAPFFKSIEQSIYSAEILPQLAAHEIPLFDSCYPLDPATGKRYINIPDPANVAAIQAIFKRLNFDTRWINFTQRNFCRPHLVVQFTNSRFYNDPGLTAHFNGHTYLHEAGANRHTFFLEVELVEAFYSADIALYKIVNTDKKIIEQLPAIEPDFSILDDMPGNLYCLQSSPNSEIGKLLNKAQIDGFLEHFGIFPDRFGGSYTFEGLRYLITGYFRFGSSGAPYIFYDPETGTFKVNAIQSEAGPQQLSIDNKREGNFQYINAIASPLSIIRDQLLAHTSPKP